MDKFTGLFYFGNQIFHIKDDDGKQFNVDEYTLKRGVPLKPRNMIVTHDTWDGMLPYRSAVELERDGMQGLVQAIFGEEV